MELIWFLRRAWDQPVVQLVLACIAFGTSFTLGFRAELGAGIAPLLDGVGMLGLVSIFGASFWLSLRIFHLFIKVSGSFLIGALSSYRDILKRWRLTRAIAFFPFWIRFKLRRHAYLYYAFWWLLLAWVIYSASSRGLGIDSAGREEILTKLGWLIFHVSGFLIFGTTYVALQGIREYRDGNLVVPERVAAALPRGSSSVQARRNQRTFAGPITLLFFLAIAGAIGQLYVAVVKYGPPSVLVVAADGSQVSGSILLTTPSGVLFFPSDTRVGTFRPLSATDRVEAIPHEPSDTP